MSSEYSIELESRSYNRGLEKLKSMPHGKVLIKAQLEEIFGCFRYQEVCEAFDRFLKEGRLLKISPGKFRIAAHTTKEIEEIGMGEIIAINSVIEKAADKIKKNVMNRAKSLNNFPLIEFGIRDHKPREVDVAEGMFSSVDVTQRAVATKKKGIILYKDDEFWTKSHIVVLTPEGIFECPYVMSALPGKPGDTTTCLSSRPDWEQRHKSPILWLRYSKKAIEELIRYSR